MSTKCALDTCNNLVTDRRSNARYCSRTCSAAASRKRVAEGAAPGPAVVAAPVITEARAPSDDPYDDVPYRLQFQTLRVQLRELHEDLEDYRVALCSVKALQEGMQAALGKLTARVTAVEGAQTRAAAGSSGRAGPQVQKLDERVGSLGMKVSALGLRVVAVEALVTETADRVTAMAVGEEVEDEEDEDE